MRAITRRLFMQWSGAAAVALSSAEALASFMHGTSGPPPGATFLVTETGDFLVDENGNYLVT